MASMACRRRRRVKISLQSRGRFKDFPKFFFYIYIEGFCRYCRLAVPADTQDVDPRFKSQDRRGDAQMEEAHDRTGRDEGVKG